MVYPELTEEAEAELKRILRGGPLKGVHLNIERGHAVKWAPPLNPGWYGIPDGNPKWAVAPATVDVNDFLRVQAETRSKDVNDFVMGAYDETVERAAESVRRGSGDIPTPVLEVHEDGTVVQEGRSRAVGAREAGARRVPIWVAVRVYK